MTDQVTFPNLLYRALMVGINALGTDPLLLFSVVRLELNQVTLRRFLELNRVNRLPRFVPNGQSWTATSDRP